MDPLNTNLKFFFLILDDMASPQTASGSVTSIDQFCQNHFGPNWPDLRSYPTTSAGRPCSAQALILYALSPETLPTEPAYAAEKKQKQNNNLTLTQTKWTNEVNEQLDRFRQTT